MHSKEYLKMRRRIASRMPYKQTLRMRVPGKGDAQALFKAKVDKKRLPELRQVREHKDPKYAHMSIEQFEREYL